ncbi:MAG: hypothetical protein AAF598_03145 [Bacteroidota bacterium]
MKTRNQRIKFIAGFAVVGLLSFSILLSSCSEEEIAFICSLEATIANDPAVFDECSYDLNQQFNFMGFFNAEYSVDFSGFDVDQTGTPQSLGSGGVTSTLFDNATNTIFFSDSGSVQINQRTEDGFSGTFEAFMKDANGNEMNITNANFSVPITN